LYISEAVSQQIEGFRCHALMPRVSRVANWTVQKSSVRSRMYGEIRAMDRQWVEEPLRVRGLVRFWEDIMAVREGLGGNGLGGLRKGK
jgi:hypothetical protein